MQFIRTSQILDCVPILLQRLNQELRQHQTVAWFVSGGSNIELSVAVLKQIDSALLPKLQIFLIDERYGPLGHPDSNAEQLKQAGFESGAASVFTVLEDGLSLEETRVRYEHLVETALEQAGYVIGQLGMGSDGHLAGILPGSSAVTATSMVAAYETPTYTRITLTPVALQHFDTVYLFGYGSDKSLALRRLQDEDVPQAEQPLQLMKHITESYIYNDQIGETV